MPASKEELENDVLNLDPDAFFANYESIVHKSISNFQELDTLRKSQELVPRYLSTLIYSSEFKKVNFSKSKEHLKTKYSQKLALVQYVYDNHKSTLEILLTKRKDWINEKLREINWILLVDEKEPDLNI